MAFPVIAVKDASSTSQNMGAFSDGSNSFPATSGDSNVPHYAAGVNQYTPLAAATAGFVIIGSATKTVRVKRIRLSGIATAAGEVKYSVKKSSDAGTLGSAVLTAVTAAPMDSAFAAPTATVNTVGTANYGTLPASVGVVATGEFAIPATGTGVGFTPAEIEFGKNGVPAIVLRGVAQTLYVDFLGATLQSGAKYSMDVVFSEDAS